MRPPSSVQFKLYLCARKCPYALHPVSQMFPQCCLWNSYNARLIVGGPVYSPFKEDRRALSLFASNSSRRSMVWRPWLLCPQVVSQAPQHFKSSETQVTCADCFIPQSACSVISLHPGLSRAVGYTQFERDVDHWHMPVWASCSNSVASSLNLRYQYKKIIVIPRDSFTTSLRTWHISRDIESGFMHAPVGIVVALLSSSIQC